MIASQTVKESRKLENKTERKETWAIIGGGRIQLESISPQ
jgi:hypothetical protein